MSPTNGSMLRLRTEKSIDEKNTRNFDDRTRVNFGFFKQQSAGKIVKRGELVLESKLES